MKKPLLFIFLLTAIFGQTFAQKFLAEELIRFKAHSKNTEIIRDSFGVPHVYGKSDADAVFGLIYAQCEDDFNRVELNYIEKLGRLSEINGEKDLFNDLQIQILIDTLEAKKDFERAEPWFKKLLVAHADGINAYLLNNPNVKPKLLKKFEPWYALLWTDGSIGAINTAGATVNELKNFYTQTNIQSKISTTSFSDHQTGSNGFAIAPTKSKSGNALLYINPHVTFYFRPEVHMISEEGLNAYGAVTWGQFFIYQGFNEFNGWMHTSSAVDVADLYEETVTKKDNVYYSTFEGKDEVLKTKQFVIRFKANEQLEERAFTVYYSRNGPIVAKRNNKWIALKSNNRSSISLVQSWKRTKTKNLQEFQEVMNLKGNTSNNTVYADRDGNIAYWHGNFVPKRSTLFNWSKPVDGSIKETEWQGLHSVNETVHLINPNSGWIQNCNSTPFTVAGTSSPKKSDFPTYMAPDGENFRGLNAIRLLNDSRKHSIDDLIQLGHERTLEGFKILIPGLTTAYKKFESPTASLDSVINLLKDWDFKSSEESIATTVAVEWAQRLNNAIQRVYIGQGEADQVASAENFVSTASANQFLEPLMTTIENLNKRYGTWKIKWGDINRFQRINNEIIPNHDDSKSSIPMGQTSALWGQLASFNSRTYSNTNKRYGYSGNSFVAAVQFGPKVKAKSVLAGGNSGDINSPNFNDQAVMYTKGKFKDILFYKEDVLQDARKIYKPGK